MSKNCLEVAEALYIEMGKKNMAGIEPYLHPHIHFMGPLSQSKGKEAYLEAVKVFMGFFNTLTIRAKFSAKDEAMIVYDVDFPAPIGKLPSAALVTFKENLVAKIELFFDASPFR